MGKRMNKVQNYVMAAGILELTLARLITNPGAGQEAQNGAKIPRLALGAKQAASHSVAQCWVVEIHQLTQSWLPTP